MVEQCSERDRFHLDLEFVQCLASPEYETFSSVCCCVLTVYHSIIAVHAIQVFELAGTARLL